MASEPKRASTFETVGAWLHVWTPPRDVEVPPVPWRWIVPAAVVLAVPLFIAVWAGVERRPVSVSAQELAERRARVEAEQAAHRAKIRPASKPRMVTGLEAAVLRDAVGRGKGGELDQRVQRVDCVPHPRTAPRRALEADPSQRSGRYHCLAVTSEFRGSRGRGTIGYPFLATIVYGTGSLTWCKINPVPGELQIPDPRKVVQLPKACQ